MLSRGGAVGRGQDYIIYSTSVTVYCENIFMNINCLHDHIGRHEHTGLREYIDPNNHICINISL